MHRLSRMPIFIALATLFTLYTMLSSPLAHTQERSGSKSVDELEQKIREDIAQQQEQKIKDDVVLQQEQRIKDDILRQLPQDVMKVLLQQNLLNRQIDRGIDEYFRKQQQAQAAALEKKEQVANEKANNVRRVVESRDHIYGNPNARVSLIEYSDFECPFCKRFHSTPKEIVDASGGKVNWVYRHFPLSMHDPGAEREAEASECANYLGGNDAFWKYANAIYARTQSNGTGFPGSQLVPLAKEIGLNRKRFQECMDGGRFASRVQEDIDEGHEIGVSSTPTNILLDNGGGEVILKSGALPSTAFNVDIGKMLGSKAPEKNVAVR